MLYNFFFNNMHKELKKKIIRVQAYYILLLSPFKSSIYIQKDNFRIIIPEG